MLFLPFKLLIVTIYNNYKHQLFFFIEKKTKYTNIIQKYQTQNINNTKYNKKDFPPSISSFTQYLPSNHSLQFTTTITPDARLFCTLYRELFTSNKKPH